MKSPYYIIAISLLTGCHDSSCITSFYTSGVSFCFDYETDPDVAGAEKIVELVQLGVQEYYPSVINVQDKFEAMNVHVDITDKALSINCESSRLSAIQKCESHVFGATIGGYIVIKQESGRGDFCQTALSHEFLHVIDRGFRLKQSLDNESLSEEERDVLWSSHGTPHLFSVVDVKVMNKINNTICAD